MIMHHIDPIELLQRVGDSAGVGELSHPLVRAAEIAAPGTGCEGDRIGLRALGSQQRHTLSCLTQRVAEQADDEFDPAIPVWWDGIPGRRHDHDVASCHLRTQRTSGVWMYRAGTLLCLPIAKRLLEGVATRF